MSTFGRVIDARWYEKRAAELRGYGQGADARRYERLAAETREKFNGGGSE
jgi:hypothetical protein